MPHYKDGTIANVGDLVRGTGYNVKDSKGEPRLLVGVLINVSPDPKSESCNCMIAFVDEIQNPQVQNNEGKVKVDDPQGKTHWLYVRTDYGETRAFERVG